MAMDKSKLLAFAKKSATPPLAAIKLNQKRAMVKPPPAVPPITPTPGGGPQGIAAKMKGLQQKPAAMPPGAPPHAPPGTHPAAAAGGEHPGEETEMYMHELVEEAAQEAEAGKDQELEDAVAGYTSKGAQDIPHWAEDPEKWKEAAEAVGIGNPQAEDRYDEPFVVAAYLYKKIGGPVKGLAALPEAPGGEQAPSDMSKPGAAAKAINARVTGGKPPAAPAAGAPPAKHPAPAPAAAKPAAPPAHAPPPAHAAPAPGAAHPPAADGGEDEMKKMLDEAANQAQTAPDPTLTQKLQEEPPQEGAPPTWAADQDKWMKAEEAVKPHWASYPDPWPVVGHVYLNMGGGVQ